MSLNPPIGRRTPSQGVKIEPGQPTILFLTVCATRPANWLASQAVHDSLLSIWHSADTWLVGDYLLMPDHIHLFCSPRDLRFTVDPVGGLLEISILPSALKQRMDLA